MDRRTASRRAAIATAVGLYLPLSLVAFSGISQLAADVPNEGVGCSLGWIQGYLVADNGGVNGRVALAEAAGLPWTPQSGTATPLPGSGMPLDWPDRWTVRPTYYGQLEVVDDWGTVRARTGAGIVLYAVVDPVGSGAWIRDGELVVCPGQWPINIMDPDFVAPDEYAP
jgi:hypothetical protein